MQENNKEKEISENEHTYDNGFHPRKVTLKNNYKFYNRSLIFRFFAFIFVTISAFFLFLEKKLILGYKVVGKKNLKKHPKGNIIVCNHCMQRDSFYIVTSLFPKKTYVTMLQSNLGFPIFSQYIRISGAVPIPEERRQIRNFSAETRQAIERGDNIVFFAEASLKPYCDHIRPFKQGAFHFAYQSGGVILPMVITFHKPKGLYKIFKRKPSPHLNILPPYTIVELESKSETIKKAMDDVHQMMSEYFNTHSDYKASKA